jgi:hypothetical protein
MKIFSSLKQITIESNIISKHQENKRRNLKQRKINTIHEQNGSGRRHNETEIISVNCCCFFKSTDSSAL